MPMSDQEYAVQGGARCPHCRSANVDSGTADVDGPDAYTEDQCKDCGQSWISRYRLVGYTSCDTFAHRGWDEIDTSTD